MRRKLLVTSALPYANGSIHLGHLVEYIQTDIWVRFQKMRGHECHYVCADDTHGTADHAARGEGRHHARGADRARLARAHPRLRRLSRRLRQLLHHPLARRRAQLSEDIYRQLKARGLIEVRPVEQFYDPVKQMFLPDRFIKGECPNCHSKDQYGDACEVCGTTYSPTDLIEPYSVVSGAKPVRKASDHYFFKLSHRGLPAVPRAVDAVRRSPAGGSAQQDPRMVRPGPERLGHLARRALLRLRDPGRARQVLLRLAGRADRLPRQLPEPVRPPEGLDFDAWARPGSETEMIHFIGKDILYFHALFWPAMLQFAGYRTPTQRVRPRLPDRRRAEDVQVARHLHHRRELSRSRG